MQPREYKVWFDKAEENLLWAKNNFEDGFYPLVCFLSQQAVELSFKGYCYHKNEIPPKLHELPKLMKKCEELGLEVKDKMIPQVSILSRYYLESRYPDVIEEDLNNEKIAKGALKFAREIVDEVRKQIPS